MKIGKLKFCSKVSTKVGREMGDGAGIVGGYKRRDHTSSETPGVM